MDKLGCFNDCKSCKLSENCCSLFNKINSPVLNKEELDRIQKNVSNNEFYESIDSNLFHLKIKSNVCVFYKNGKCSIYNCRPIDCKLYPFDIIKNCSKYYLIIYKLDCIDIDKLMKESTDIDILINLIIPWIDKFTDERNYTKMKELDYKVIKEIKL